MRLELLQFLRCPSCHGRFRTEGEVEEGRLPEGRLCCVDCAASFPVLGNIPRFVERQSYADNFGLQWNLFKRTQLDSSSGRSISRDRFLSYTGWDRTSLEGQLVLDAGCGAGRFAEIAASLGGHVIAVDYSSAVEAARDNLAGAANVDFIQADINALPFAPGTFPFVYCLGVIQHTPDPHQSFRSLAGVTATDGRLAVDVYPQTWKNLFFAKYWIRPLTKRISPERALKVVKKIFPVLYPVSCAVSRIPFLGRYLKYLIPVANYSGVYPLNSDQLREWALLDTFDMWAPAYDQPQTLRTVADWFETGGFRDVETFHAGFFVGRGVKSGAR